MSETDDDWWQRTWQERHDEVENALGPVEDLVTSFSWQTPRIPGACAVTLPPAEHEPFRRSEWLYLSMGLSQPLSLADVRQRRANKEAHSGLGCEFAVLTPHASPWAAKLLYELTTFFTEPSVTSFGAGDRVPFGMYLVDGAQHPMVGVVEDRPPTGDLRGLLLWTYRRRSRFLTSTGTADVLVATGITAEEWELAKSTTSQHLILLFEKAGIGQTTDLARSCVTRDPAAMSVWAELKNLDAREAWQRATQPPTS